MVYITEVCRPWRTLIGGAPVSIARTSLRAAAVLGATAAMTVAGAGAAMATSTDSSVEGNTVTVTFELDRGQLVDGDTCGALLTPTSSAPAFAARLATGDLTTILGLLTDEPDVTVLTSDRTGLPAVGLGELLGMGFSSATASATVEPNVYALVTYCLTDSEPKIEAPLIVGDPFEAVSGSLNGLSSDGDTIGILSSALGGGDGEGGGPLDMLSSTLGGPAGD